VITWVRQLEELNLVESRSDAADKRKRIVSLTETGTRQVALMAEPDRMLAQAYRDLFDEARTDLLAPLWTIEHSMRDVPFADRLAKISQEATTAFDRPT
jgi:DNA-binding MarR family transcriptional regulator